MYVKIDLMKEFTVKKYIIKGSYFETYLLPLKKLFSLVCFWSVETTVEKVKIFTGIYKKKLRFKGFNI